MKDTPVLTVNNLRVEFPHQQQPVVEGSSFRLDRGQTLGIVGESGSGKSITALAVMGLLPQPGKVTGGEIIFRSKDELDREGVNLLSLSPPELTKYRGRSIGMIFQEPMTSLNPVFTIGWQLIEAILEHQSISKAEARRRAIHLLQKVKLIESDVQIANQLAANINDDRQRQEIVNQSKLSWLDRYPHELSGGQLQRVTIAMAISCEPTLLIADEPTTALDVTVQAAILDLLQELQDTEDMSMIFITHDLGVIAEVADRVAVMYKGRIVEDKPVLELFAEPEHPYTKGLLSCRPRLDTELDRLLTVKDFMKEEILADGRTQIIELPINASSDSDRELQSERAIELPTIQPKLEPILAIRRLVVGFPKRGTLVRDENSYTWAVNNVSFEVQKGETLGLVGESGCGKSTIARTILRLIEPRHGAIVFNGKDITKLRGSRLQSYRRELQIVFQNPFSALDPRMTIGDLVAEPLVIHGLEGSRQQKTDRVMALLDRVGIPNRYLKSYPHQLSGGQRQRVCIARALILQPQLIICDESVSALDVSVQAQVLNLLKDLQQDFGLTYIFISHDLSVVKFMSDRIMVMEKGKIVETDHARAIYTHPRQEYTRRLIDAIPLGTLDRIYDRQQRRSRLASN
jgi:peptide/nickel transport system ATP-binding protein